MLILPPGHAEQIRASPRLSGRERWILRGVLGLVAAGVIALIIALSLPGPKSSHGCVYLIQAGPVGAQYIDRCGEEARALCSTARSQRAYAPQALVAECRRAGLPTAGRSG